MSVQAITCAFALQGVTPSEKLVLLALANYADSSMRCWPSQCQLASDTGMGERTVRRVIAGLEGRRILARQERRRSDGYRASDLITLHFAGEVVPISPAKLSTDKMAVEISPAKIVDLTGQIRPISPATVAGPTTLEPPLEPSREPSLLVVSAEPKPTGPAPEDVNTAFAEWNAVAGRLGLPTARALDPARRKAIRARLADGGLVAWREALAAIERSPHCRGQNDRNWRADLDFLCQAKSWRRLLEGSYGAGVETVIPFRGQGPPSLVDRIGEENAEARRKTLELLETKNG